MTKINSVKLIKVNMSLIAILTHKGVVGLFLRAVELLHSRSKNIIRDAFS